MASFVAIRAASTKTNSLGNLSISLIRNFSTDSTNPKLKKKNNKKKNKNLIEVAQFLPNWGLGYHMAKTHWESVSYEITKINLYKYLQDGRHGKAWGIAHKDGSPIADAPKKISGVHKRCWRYLPNSNKIQESTLKTEALAT